MTSSFEEPNYQFLTLTFLSVSIITFIIVRITGNLPQDYPFWTYIVHHECQNATATPAHTADAAAFCSTKVYLFLLTPAKFCAACLARGRARQACPKVLVYYHRVAGTAAT